jgi:hypothetical protein
VNLIVTLRASEGAVTKQNREIRSETELREAPHYQHDRILRESKDGGDGLVLSLEGKPTGTAVTSPI